MKTNSFANTMNIKNLAARAMSYKGSTFLQARGGGGLEVAYSKLNWFYLEMG